MRKGEAKREFQVGRLHRVVHLRSIPLAFGKKIVTKCLFCNGFKILSTVTRFGSHW